MTSSVAALFLRRMSSFRGFKLHTPIKHTDNEIDDLEMQVVRYKPEGLDMLCKNTKFTRKELQIMYRGFKQECPTGIVNEETFKEIYAQFFPQGDATAYAHYVFNTFDHDHNGSISFEDIAVNSSIFQLSVDFLPLLSERPGQLSRKSPAGDEPLPVLARYETLRDKRDYGESSVTPRPERPAMEFVTGLSVLSRGTFQERLQWAFSLYDVNGDGIITKEEMLDIVTAIYEMMGRYTEPSIDDTTAREHVERVFQKMDINQDGVISVEEFMDTCKKDENITKGMSIFDTIL